MDNRQGRDSPGKNERASVRSDARFAERRWEESAQRATSTRGNKGTEKGTESVGNPKKKKKKKKNRKPQNKQKPTMSARSGRPSERVSAAQKRPRSREPLSAAKKQKPAVRTKHEQQQQLKQFILEHCGRSHADAVLRKCNEFEYNDVNRFVNMRPVEIKKMKLCFQPYEVEYEQMRKGIDMLRRGLRSAQSYVPARAHRIPIPVDARGREAQCIGSTHKRRQPLMCYTCKALGHTSKHCPSVRCTCCHQQDHNVHRCPHLSGGAQSRTGMGLLAGHRAPRHIPASKARPIDLLAKTDTNDRPTSQPHTEPKGSDLVPPDIDETDEEPEEIVMAADADSLIML
eukprot:Stramenopile-MAST_4_protein_1674